MRRTIAVSIALLVMGCSETKVMAPITGSANPVIVVGSETFYVKGASYGPTWDEVSDTGCGGPLFSWTQDSTRWVFTSGDTTWVHGQKYAQSGCALGTENSGGANYVGGTADIVASRPSICVTVCTYAVQIIADQSSSGMSTICCHPRLFKCAQIPTCPAVFGSFSGISGEITTPSIKTTTAVSREALP